MRRYPVVKRDKGSQEFIGTIPGPSIYVEAESKDAAIGALREAIPPHMEALRTREARGGQGLLGG